ncbi:hypothetical protein [Poriferisphaera sp. WC338]|uniref:hypothetical protein n=1 Tax=Poriferisphaera sp. WC338 TaxID=3425129 RepID=UPI003D818B42
MSEQNPPQTPEDQNKQTTSESLEGQIPPLTDDTMRRKAVDLAFDYRGDVTIETTSGQSFTGYLYNRDGEAAKPYATMMLKGEAEQRLLYSEIAKLTFSGKDPAAGKTWESWLKRYVEKKLKGEAANIESETLDD